MTQTDFSTMTDNELKAFIDEKEREAIFYNTLIKEDRKYQEAKKQQQDEERAEKIISQVEV